LTRLSFHWSWRRIGHRFWLGAVRLREDSFWEGLDAGPGVKKDAEGYCNLKHSTTEKFVGVMQVAVVYRAKIYTDTFLASLI
jgi:hypothetical protein